MKVSDTDFAALQVINGCLQQASSPSLRRRSCCGDGDAQAYPRSHILVVPAASSGHRETGARRRADLISSQSRSPHTVTDSGVRTQQ